MPSPSRANNFMLAMLTLGVAFGFLVGQMVMFLQALFGFTLPISSWQILWQTVVLLVPCLVYILVTRRKLSDLFPMRPLSVFNVVFILLMTIFIMPAAIFLSALTSLFSEPNLHEFVISMYHEPFAVIILATCIVPAVFEELALRGIVQSEYGHVSIKKAALINGLFFAILHLSVEQFLYAFLLGAVFAFFVHYTKSILSAVLAHLAFNFIQVLMSYIAHHAALQQGETPPLLLPPPALYERVQMMAGIAVPTVLATGVFWVLFMVFAAHNKRRNMREMWHETPLPTSDTDAVLTVKTPKMLTWSFWVLVIGFAVGFVVLPLIRS